MQLSEAGSALGQKVWSNSRWGEIVALKDGRFEVHFNVTHPQHQHRKRTHSIESSTAFKTLWGDSAKQ